MVVPRLVTQALTGAPLTVYGTGEQTRCFSHVYDVVPALHKLMNCEKAFGQVINVGNDVEASINELAQRVREIVNPDSVLKRIPYQEAYGAEFEDMGSRRPNLSKLKSLIPYEPARGLDDIIRDVRDFVKGQLKAEAP